MRRNLVYALLSALTIFLAAKIIWSGKKSIAREGARYAVYEVDLDPERLQRRFNAKIPGSILKGSFALHAEGLQSFALWVKLETAKDPDLEEVMNFIKSDFLLKRKRPFRYKLTTIDDRGLKQSGISPPEWWKAYEIEAGTIYSAGDDGAVFIDERNSTVYISQSD